MRIVGGYFLRGVHVAVLTFFFVATFDNALSEVLYSRPIMFDDKHYGDIKISSKREPVDTIHAFCKKHNLPPHVKRGIMVDVCKQEKVVCTRDKPVLFRTPITINGTKLGVLKILEGEEPADIIFHFARTRPKVTAKMKKALLRHACKAMKCTRNKAVVYTKPLVYEGKTYPKIVLYDDGKEPSDKIYKFTYAHGLPRHIHRAVVTDVCSVEWIECQRTAPVVYRAPMLIPNRTKPVELEIYESEEPADKVHHFLQKYNLSKALSKKILLRACRKTKCSRTEHAKFVDSVHHPVQKEDIHVGIVDGVEPADVLQQWSVEYDIPRSLREKVLKRACKVFNCTRERAKLYERPIMYDDVDQGNVVVLEDEEPADIVQQFCLNRSLPVELRNTVIEDACKTVKCTRLNPIILETAVVDENGTWYANVTFFDGEEPADKIYSETKDTNITHEIKHEFLLQNVCSVIPCRRDRAILFQNPVVANGKKYPDLIIFDAPDQEPTDVVYNYCKKHQIPGLHMQLLTHACQAARCSRAEPIIFRSIILGEKNEELGTLKIKQGEEPADAIFEFCKEQNCTEHFRRNLLTQICPTEGIECSRAEAMILSVPVVHPDYGNFGTLYVPENREPADVVEEFSNKIFLPRDFRGSIITHVCNLFGKHYWFKNCTRRLPLLLNQSLKVDNRTLPRLEIFGAGEPADTIDRWAEEYGIEKHIRDTVIHNLCSRDNFQCKRTIPCIFRITVSEFSESPLEVMENEEAIDAVTKYMRINGAPQHKRRQLFDIACKAPRVICTRRKGVYYKNTVQGIDEPLVIWDDNLETVDAIYKWGKRNNLTWMERDRIYRAVVPVTKSGRGEVMIASFPVNNDTVPYCHRLLQNAPFREYELFSGSLVALMLSVPLLTVNAFVGVNPILSSLYLGLSAALSYFVAEPLSVATRVPSPQLEATNYFNLYHVAEVMVREGQQPYDAVYEFGKSREGAKFETLRTPKFDHIFEGLCEDEGVKCNRRFAQEEMFKAEVSQHGHKRFLHYMKPLNESKCKPIEENGVLGTTCTRRQSRRFCKMLDPPPSSCVSQIMGLINQHMVTYNKRKWNGRRLYRTLDSLMDASNATMWKRYLKARKEFVKPCFPGPTPLGFSTMERDRLHTLGSAWGSVGKDPDERAFYDQPCRIVFGAMCAKTKKSGDMIIETMQPE
jgi:hypothetical protein